MKRTAMGRIAILGLLSLLAGCGGKSTTAPTINAPPVPNLIFPANRATDQPLSLRLLWHRSSGATSYQVQTAVDSSFASVSIDSAGKRDTTMTLNDLPANTTWFWRVRASDGQDQSDWSSVWRFQTAAAPGLIVPADNASGQSLYTNLRWHTLHGATEYHLELALDEAFTTLVGDSVTVQDTTYTTSLLTGQTLYYWRVRAKLGTLTRWSTARHFTTVGPWDFPASPKSAISLLADVDHFALGDSFDVKVVAYGLPSVFGVAAQVNYPHRRVEITRIIYNPTSFADPSSYLVLPLQNEPASDRISFGFTYLRGSNNTLPASVVIARLRCRAVQAGAVTMAFDASSLSIIQASGAPIPNLSNLEKDPLVLTIR